MRRKPVVLIAALLGIEGLLKAWAVANLSPGVGRALLPGLLHLGFTLNPGMAWGLLGGLTAPLAALRLLVGLVIVAALLSGRVRLGWGWPLALIAAGALGNALDGLMRGAVVDYLTSPLLDSLTRPLTGETFPIFNLSDVLVFSGAAGLLLHAGWTERRAGRPTPDRRGPSQTKENP
ncbi:lipoprotein signal peptidase [Deinococcus carri]|uniref:Lipoprotein signal peptidase n=1 Tax=Deinococcus carri TaxID=1211323 RepID=A0ABP9WCE6_9DEIO